jgi:hypothetical protein
MRPRAMVLVGQLTPKPQPRLRVLTRWPRRSQPLFGHCALEEHWEAVKDDQVLFTAKVIRAYDASTQRVPIQVRLTWRPHKAGYAQLIERSRDGGLTWTLGGFVTFQPDPNTSSR